MRPAGAAASRRAPSHAARRAGGRGALALTSVALALVPAALALAGGPARAADPAVKEFERAFAAAADDAARAAAVARLAEVGTRDAAQALVRLALEPSLAPPVRDVAEAGLLGRGLQADVVLHAADVVAGKAKERDPRARALWCRALGAHARREPAAAALVAPGLRDEAWQVQVAAVDALAGAGGRAAVEALVGYLPRASGRPLADALAALAGLTGERHPDPAAWAAWWAARRDAWTPPGPGPAGATGGAPGAPAAGGDRARPDPHRTVTRLAAPTGGGRTIYGEVESSAVVFVVDVSYSMRVKLRVDDGQTPTRLEYVQQALAAAIEEQLDDADRFEVIAFADGVRPWAGKLVKATAANKRKALTFVRGLAPDTGTNVHDALEAAWRVPDVDTIYFLTDGNPTQGKRTVTDEILAAARGWDAGRGVRVHAVAFLIGDPTPFQVVEDKGMAARFLRALAEQTGGRFTLFDGS